MFYYNVAIGGRSRGSSGIFTYEYDKDLTCGQLVILEFQAKITNGFIVKKSSKPTFKTKTIIESSGISLTHESLEVFKKLISYYPSSDVSLANLFIPPSLKIPKSVTFEVPLKALAVPKINKLQMTAFESITKTKGTCILHGDTGTGKTRIYMHLAKHYLKLGRSVLIMAPEIGLSSFLYKEMCKYFPSALFYHSKLTTKQRMLVWNQLHESTKPEIVIGPRSTLGLPIKNIGLIIADEAHDQSYRQENAPFINAKILASMLADANKSSLVLGSATPLVSEYKHAKMLNIPIIRLTDLAVKSSHVSKTEIISYDDESQRRGGSLLRSSVDAINYALSMGGQSLVLINRRGTARYIVCANCNHEYRCDRCDRLLTYHHDRYELRCHHCDYSYTVPSKCTICGKSEIKMSSFGSKAVTEELTKLFPEAVIKRYDTDTDKKDHLLSHTEELLSGEFQILIGTQMLAKGLDLPKLKTLVVFMGGSSSGYMSEEREFQLLYQVMGRAMRGHTDTRILIQTTNPKSIILKLAIERNYNRFYKRELKDRKKFYYPPFCHMLLIRIRRKTSAGTQSTAEKLQTNLKSKYKNIWVSEPTPDTNERTGPFYCWHMLIKSPHRKTLTNIVDTIGANHQCELDPVDIP